MAKALLIIQTANGYVVVPHTGDLSTQDLSEVKVATDLGESYYVSSNTVSGIAKAYFEPVKVAPHTAPVPSEPEYTVESASPDEVL